MRPSLILGLCIASLAAGQALARINVDTLPGRESTQLTIYNSVDLTLVRETRFLTLRKGLNRLEFSWANTLIDPTSVEFKALSHANDVEVLDVSFPPRVTNTLEWRVESEVSGEVQVEIRYFTSGINWEADYTLEADRDEKTASLAGFVKVTNHSGEDYENTQVRLVVGVVRLVESIDQLSRDKSPARPRRGAQSNREPAKRLMEVENTALGLEDSFQRVAGKPAEITKEGLSEYFLYTVEGRDSIPDGWGKRLPSFVAKSVPVTSFYKYEEEAHGKNVERFYRFKNDKESNLGAEPLPNGRVAAFRTATEDALRSLVGQTTVKYVPVNEELDLDLGADPEVRVTPALVDWRKEDLRFDEKGNVSGWTVVSSWKIEIQNSREIPVTVDLRRRFGGDWTLKCEDAYESLDAGKIKFLLKLDPRQKKSVGYEVTTRFGTNATR